MNGFLTRKDLSALMGVSVNRVGEMDRKGMFPCKASTIFSKLTKDKSKEIMIYPEVIMLDWIANGRHKPVKKRDIKAETNGVIFKQIFAGHFLPKSKQELIHAKKVKARMSGSKTKTVKLESDWGMR